MIVHQNTHSTNSMQQSLVRTTETKNNQFISPRMQHPINEEFVSQRDHEFYGQSSNLHYQYQHENHLFSPQQSSTSDVEESSTFHKTHNPITNKIMKKKKQSKKKRKDPNEPQKPVSPYALFFRDTQNDIKKKLANPSFGEISKVVAHMWENIDPEVKEQYKRKAAAAKKEYLKQLAAYRAVQISHQSPNMHHLLNQTSLPFNSHQQKSYHTGSMITNHHHPHHHPQQQQYCPSSSIQQYNNFHYINPYSQDNSTVYHSDRSIQYSNHPHQTYSSSYDSNNNNNYPEYQQYNLLQSEHYSSYYSQLSLDNEHPKTNENLLHNLNHSAPHYTDLSNPNDKQHYHHQGLNEKKEDNHSTFTNENNFHWNQTTEW